MRPRPNPRAFDGHWLGRGDMARLAGISTTYLDFLVFRGLLPGDTYRPGRHHREYDAGKVLLWQQTRQDGRRRQP